MSTVVELGRRIVGGGYLLRHYPFLFLAAVVLVVALVAWLNRRD